MLWPNSESISKKSTIERFLGKTALQIFAEYFKGKWRPGRSARVGRAQRKPVLPCYHPRKQLQPAKRAEYSPLLDELFRVLGTKLRCWRRRHPERISRQSLRCTQLKRLFSVDPWDWKISPTEARTLEIYLKSSPDWGCQPPAVAVIEIRLLGWKQQMSRGHVRHWLSTSSSPRGTFEHPQHVHFRFIFPNLPRFLIRERLI